MNDWVRSEFSEERQSAPIPDWVAHVDDRLRVEIIKSIRKHSEVRDWVLHLWGSPLG